MVGFSVLIKSAFAVINLDWLPHWSIILHWKTVLSPWVRLGMLCNPCGNMSACLPYIDGFASTTSEFINHVGFEVFIKARHKAKETAPKFPSGEYCLYRVNFVQLLDEFIRDVASVLQCKMLFLVFFCCFSATPELYLFLWTFNCSWLIVSLTIFPNA